MEDQDRESHDVLPAGTRFGRYQIRRLLGRGAFGAVYEALQLEPLQRAVALKVLHEVARSDPQLVVRFVREAQIAASITHPHICTVFDIGSEEGVPFIAMERLHGEALDACLDRQRVLSPAATVDTLLPVLSAVAAVHDAGIVHRDLKPANIFLATPRPGAVVPKLLDFGIVKVLDRDANVARTETRTFLGTPHYTSPEQAMDSSSIDVRSDQWALGVILYECLTGSRPWREGPVLQVLFEITAADIAPPSSRRPTIPAALDAVVMRALTRDPSQRFPSVRALAAALLPFASESVRSVWSDEFLPHASPTPRPAEQAPAGRPPRAAPPLFDVHSEPRLEPDPEAALRARSVETKRGVPRPPRYASLQAAPPPPAPARRLLWPALAAGVALLATAAFLAARSSPSPSPSPSPSSQPDVTPISALPAPEPAPEPAPPPAPPPPMPSTPVVLAPPVALPDAGAPTRTHGRPRHRPLHPGGETLPTPAPPAGGIPNV